MEILSPLKRDEKEQTGAIWSHEASLTSCWAESNCHSLSSPSVSAMMTLAVPAEHRRFKFSLTIDQTYVKDT